LAAGIAYSLAYVNVVGEGNLDLNDTAGG